MRTYPVLVFGQATTTYIDVVVEAETLAEAIGMAAGLLAANFEVFGTPEAEIFAVRVGDYFHGACYRVCYAVSPFAGSPGFYSALPDTDALLAKIRLAAARQRHPSNPTRND